MNSWLYPISKTSGYYLEDERGQRVEASYENFRRLVFTGCITNDEWRVNRNFDKVRPGDELFIYTGNGDCGIIGYAEVIGKAVEKKRVAFRLDQAKTKLLLADPVTAGKVRPLIPWPRAPLVNLERGIRKLRKHLPWNSAYRARLKEMLSALKLRPDTFTTARIRGGDRQQRLRHDSVLAPVRVYLRGKGFQIGTRNFNRLRADLVALRGREVIIVEAKIIKLGAGRLQAREGLGQLLEYSWWLRRERTGSSRKHILWLAFFSRPKLEVCEFLASQNVVVSWPSRTGLTFFNSRDPVG